MARMNRSIRLLPVVLAALAAGAVPLAAQREPGGHTLRDPSSRIRDRAPADRGPFRAVSDSAQAAAAAAPTFKLYFTPTVGWDDANTRIGAQLKLKRDARIPISFALTDQLIVADGENANRIKGNGEIDLVNNDRKLLGLPVFLAALGELSYTQRSGTFAEAAGALDFAVIGNGDDPPSLSLGVLGYYDYFAPVEGDSDSGPTAGLESLWLINDWLELDGEYDFNSSFNGEDTFSTRLVVTLSSLPSQPLLILGAAKHNTFTFGVRFARPLRLSTRAR